jgi:hypothetical protein
MGHTTARLRTADVTNKSTLPGVNIAAICNTVDNMVQETRQNMATKYIEINTTLAAIVAILPRAPGRRRRATITRDQVGKYIWDHVPA